MAIRFLPGRSASVSRNFVMYRRKTTVSVRSERAAASPGEIRWKSLAPERKHTKFSVRVYTGTSTRIMQRKQISGLIDNLMAVVGRGAVYCLRAGLSALFALLRRKRFGTVCLSIVCN